MKKQLSHLTLGIALLIALPSPHIQAAAAATELPAVNIAACEKLYKATNVGDIERVQQALEEGADINMRAQYDYIFLFRHNLSPKTPLYMAAVYGRLNLVKLLLNHGAMIDAATISDTPLTDMCLAEGLLEPLVKAINTELLTHKANSNAQQFCSKSTPLCCAIRALNDEFLVSKLILAGADRSINTLAKLTFIQADIPPCNEIALAAKPAHTSNIQKAPPAYKGIAVLSSYHTPVIAAETQNLIAAACEKQPANALDAQAQPYAPIQAQKINEASPAYIPIVCHKCTYHNPDYAQRCEICDTLFEAAEADEEVKEAF